MRIIVISLLVLTAIFGLVAWNLSDQPEDSLPERIESNEVIPGAERMRKYIPELQGKRVGLVVNQTSMVGDKHLVDSLLDFEINLVKIFAPEHGFRGQADAGAHINDGKDVKTGLAIKSLHGSSKKPSPKDLEDIDIMVFDIQDVGCRFYTYISTMSYVMESCAENDVPVIVLDRPNPNGHYIDGPVLNPEYASFVGMHEVPVVYGMTIGEYAKMVNGEGWLKGGIQCDLKVVSCLEYDHTWSEALKIKPSPNLPDHRSILLYPSLCFFEGTVVSIGRGTTTPFSIIGHPDYSQKDFAFTPLSGPGAKYPKLENQTCYGKDLNRLNPRFIKTENQLNLNYLLDFYRDLNLGESFFLKNQFIDKLAGTDQLRKQIHAGLSADEIRFSWEQELDAFKSIRSKYLLYD